MQSSQSAPPAAFLEKMSRLLGEEFDAFRQALTRPPLTGLRVNSLKISAADFSRKFPFVLKPAGAYAPNGFLLAGDGRPGRHPWHAAGLYYLQEPSAMAVARLVDPQPGEWVLDLAAAPGGKSTHLAALMQDSGLLAANDVDGRRAKILAGNLERWGTRQTLVLNARLEQLARRFGPVFDRALLDAPCSGEAMFRRLGAFPWEAGLAMACARRQTAALAAAARLVRPGGRLVYATCAFSPEENESVIARFLADHADFSLIDPPRWPGFDRGRPEWVEPGLPANGLEKTVRLWPHKFAGEGHFVAVMERESVFSVQCSVFSVQCSVFSERRSALRGEDSGRREALRVWRAFAGAYLTGEWPEERLWLWRGRLWLRPEGATAVPRLPTLRYGLLLGEARKGHFRPAHALALALRPSDAAQTLDWPADSPEIRAYLAGQTLPAPAAKGWTLVCADGFALGWGKAVNGRLQNHYPRGLRRG